MNLDSVSYRATPHLFSDKRKPLVSIEEINQILTNENLIERNSFHVVNNSMYENFDRSNTHLDEISRITQALEAGKTIIVKDLEMWGGAITDTCRSMGQLVTAHMYLSPPNGTAFDFHVDDTDVVVCMLYGAKSFEFKNRPMKRLVPSGTSIYIPQGVEHRAKQGNGWSCHISFGIPRKMIKDSYHSYPIQIDCLNNLKPLEPSLHLNIGNDIIM